MRLTRMAIQVERAKGRPGACQRGSGGSVRMMKQESCNEQVNVSRSPHRHTYTYFIGNYKRCIITVNIMSGWKIHLLGELIDLVVISRKYSEAEHGHECGFTPTVISLDELIVNILTMKMVRSLPPQYQLDDYPFIESQNKANQI